MNLLAYVLNLVMFRLAILILDGCSQTPKLVKSKSIIFKWIINNSDYCEITDSEVIVVS
jgi:hypothetical protein